MLRHVFAASIIFASAVPAMTQEDPLSIVTAADKAYDQAFDAHDAERLTAFYADDATALPPTSPAVRGSKALLEFWQVVLKGNWTAHNFQVVKAQFLSDSTILATAHWSATLTDANGKTTPFRGDTAQIFIRTNKGWKIQHVSWNLLK